MAVVTCCAGLGSPESSSRCSGLGANQVRAIPGTTLRDGEREAENSQIAASQVHPGLAFISSTKKAFDCILGQCIQRKKGETESVGLHLCMAKDSQQCALTPLDL